MKKLFLFVVAAFAMLATSCQRDEVALDASGEGLVVFSVSAEDMATRAYSDGMTARNLEYVVYDANWAYVQEGATTFPTGSLKTSVSMRLVNGKTYNIVFWASANRTQDPIYTFDKVNAQLVMNYAYVNTFSQDESRDAFYHTEPSLTVNGGIQKDIVLKRPFAQLNVATADYDAAVKAGVTVDQTQMKVSGIYSNMSFKDGSVSGATSVTFRLADIPDGENETLVTKSGQSYRWISMNYILVEPQKQLVKCNMITEEADVAEKEWNNVPVRRNWRTNIIGNIFTSSVDFNVEINPNYDGEYEYSAWDGSYAELPTPDAAGVITINTADQLATLLNMDPEGMTIKLGADIDMNGRDLAVYADGAKGSNAPFVLDGQGHTIYNVAPKADGKFSGLFPILVNATVKNLFIEGANVMPAPATTRATTGDFYAGALAGATYGMCEFDNVVVMKSNVQGVNKVGGLVGFVAENNIKVNKCVVSYSNVGTFSEEDGGNVGGLIGYIATNGENPKSHTIDKSSVTNTTIEAINSANEAKRANSEFVGTFEGGEASILYITDCTIEANTFNQKATSYVAPEGYKGLLGGNRYGLGTIVIDGVVADGTLPEPEFVPEATEWGVVGDLTGWGSNKDLVMYTTETENLFVAQDVVYESGGFKIRANNEWNDAKNYGGYSAETIAVNGSVSVYTSGGSSNLMIAAAGVYDIYFDLAEKLVWVMEDGLLPGEGDVVEPEEPIEDVWTIVGSINGWDAANGIALEAAADGWYVAYAVELAADAQFKFVCNGSWAVNRGYGAVELDQIYTGTQDGANITVKAGAGTYDIYFNPETSEFYVYTEYVEPTPVPEFTVKAEYAEGVEVKADFESVVIGNIANYDAETVMVTVDSENLEATVTETGDVVVARKAEFAEGFNGKVTISVNGEVIAEVAFVVAAPEVKITSVADFLAAEENDTVYTLSGTITKVENTTYGNFYLMDDTGEVLIYGLCSPEGEAKYWEASGAKLGDDITVKTVRSSHNGVPQGKNAIFVELVTPGTRAFLNLASDSASFAAEGGEKSIDLTIYNTTDEVKCTSNNAQFSASYADGKITIVAAANETEEAIDGEISVECGSLAATITVKQEGNKVVITSVADFLAAEEDDTIYTLSGTITAVANTSYGNFDLTDDTGTVYIYGLCSPEGATKYWAESGAKLGDDITIKTVRTSFNGTAQGKNATFVELVTPGTRAFYTVSSQAVDFASTGGESTISVVAYNTTAAVSAVSDNAQFNVAVNGYNVVVSSAANEIEEEITGNVTIKVGDLAETVVKVTLAAKPADGVVEGGQDDFNTISATNTSYVSGKTTAGWTYANCAIFKGGTSNSSPAFVMIGDADNRALCMNGKTSAVGSITSPTFTTGCGTLKFSYGLPFSDTKIKFNVDIIQNGETVKTITVENLSATKQTKYTFEETIDVAGEFSIKFSNLSPSNTDSNKDRTAIWDVEWTGYAN